MRTKTPTLLALAALAASAALASVPPAAAQPDPIDCALMPVDPALRPRLWENATKYGAYSVNATLWALAGVTLRDGEGNGTAGNGTGNQTGNATGNGTRPSFPPLPPMPDLAGKAIALGEATSHAIAQAPPTAACLDESAGLLDALDAITRETGRILAEVADILAPIPGRVFALEKEIECAAVHALGMDPEDCREAEA
jgi:hypothetical protein